MTETLAVGRDMDYAVAEWMGDDILVFDKHRWKIDEHGEIDVWAMDADPLPHNGPSCSRCGYCFCLFCKPDGYDAEPCKISAPYYSSSLAAAETVWKELARRGMFLSLTPSADGRWQCNLANQNDVPLFYGSQAEAICRAALEWGPRHATN